MHPALDRIAALALALPNAARIDKGGHAQFLAGKKTFAYFLDNHHGDGIVSICCKVFPGDNDALVKADPKRYYPPAYLAARGWVAFRLDVGEPDWDVAGELLCTSHLLCTARKAKPAWRPRAVR